MREIVLIAFTFLRQQRIYVLLMVAYIAAWTGVTYFAGSDLGRDDAWFVVKQLAAYALFLGVLLASSAVHNERRSRRILSVLSKGISRRQYLVGLWFGVMAVVLIYCLALGTLAGLAFHGLVGLMSLGSCLAMVFICAMALSATAMFFSAWLHPLFVMAATAIVIALPHALGLDALAPAGALLQQLLRYPNASPVSFAQYAAITVSSALWLWLAGKMFAGRDLTLAIE